MGSISLPYLMFNQSRRIFHVLNVELHPISEITPSEARHKFDEYDLRPANLVVVERSW
ncbi:hypothetical protein QUO16_004838 [Vibrio parahaemolyticus]|uniref:hypothetical protein n=1 Tax=Vibrio parahaemolyticus TaxID=670 RepID=UPI0014823A53|nr:hypothetical protein [Vibrio parahaemolyticus]ELA9370589.1 hypothetical protein [Vibrio parahaemolyticus]ELA9373498.1 hypothetical protein [Vibrio parahaemolyticus]HCG5508777.1 hypothetical protein [Vibrio parahaemolyticus]HCG5511867.1 hypothetical protein [Vibrio parahaemolyticus]HCG8706111.1 hypothetical protein [Vibrio parahaemolyticus]